MIFTAGFLRHFGHFSDQSKVTIFVTCINNGMFVYKPKNFLQVKKDHAYYESEDTEK